jgi:hypothetical protein
VDAANFLRLGKSSYGSVVESVDTPDLKSVEHYARGSSSLPTPISKLTFNSKKGAKKILGKNFL